VTAHYVTRVACPWGCKYGFDRVTPITGARTDAPVGGDFGICFNCGEPHVFGDDGTVRRAEAPDLDVLDQDVYDKLLLLRQKVIDRGPLR